MDRDFLGVGFMLMCRGVPTSVQTLTQCPILKPQGSQRGHDGHM